MKKVLSFIFCILLMLGTSACKIFETEPNNNSSQDNQLQSVVESEIELDFNLLRALTSSHNTSQIKNFKIFHDNHSKVTEITDTADWEFFKKYLYDDTITYEAKEKLIASSKTCLIEIGNAGQLMYLLKDGRIIKQVICSDSEVKEKDKTFEIYKADEKYMLSEKRLTELLKKYKSTAIKTNSNKTSSKEDKNTSSKTETTTSSDKNINKNELNNQNQTALIKSRLPQVKHSPKNNEVSLYDVINLSNGGFAAVGYKKINDNYISIIQKYDENSNLVKEYSYNDENGFNKIAACSDGGFIVSSQFSSHITKIDSNFKSVWVKEFEEDGSLARALDVEEINPNCYAVVYDSSLYSEGTLKISYMDKKGNIIEIIDLAENFDAYDTEIIADGNGGFYLMTICDESLADKYSMVRQDYDKTKSDEVIIMHFAANRKLKWVKTLGGGGNDWIDAATVDDKGNFYIAITTDSPSSDSFWEMKVDMYDPARSMLVKLSKKGDLIYKTPLSSRGSGSDQVLGIHLRDNKVYVVGKSEYFDGYQNKYYSSHTPTKETYESVFVTYSACFDSKGKELGRDLYRCDPVNAPIDSLLLPNGSIVVAGWVSEKDNRFNLKTLAGVERGMAFFVFKAG